jgi:hypothetical protein
MMPDLKSSQETHARRVALYVYEFASLTSFQKRCAAYLYRTRGIASARRYIARTRRAVRDRARVSKLAAKTRGVGAHPGDLLDQGNEKGEVTP